MWQCRSGALRLAYAIGLDAVNPGLSQARPFMWLIKLTLYMLLETGWRVCMAGDDAMANLLRTLEKLFLDLPQYLRSIQIGQSFLVLISRPLHHCITVQPISEKRFRTEICRDLVSSTSSKSLPSPSLRRRFQNDRATTCCKASQNLNSTVTQTFCHLRAKHVSCSEISEKRVRSGEVSESTFQRSLRFLIVSSKPNRQRSFPQPSDLQS
jgi:hypothetical protein